MATARRASVTLYCYSMTAGRAVSSPVGGCEGVFKKLCHGLLATRVLLDTQKRHTGCEQPVAHDCRTIETGGLYPTTPAGVPHSPAKTISASGLRARGAVSRSRSFS